MSITILGRGESGEKAKKRTGRRGEGRGRGGKGEGEGRGKGMDVTLWNGIPIALAAIGSNPFFGVFIHSFIQELSLGCLLCAGSVHSSVEVP